jgi:alpha-beta hydrolase superfamily lysophospholipase
MDWSAQDIRTALNELQQLSPKDGQAYKDAQQSADVLLKSYWQFYGLDYDVLGLAKPSAWLINVESQQICVQQFTARNERGRILVLHGYYDHVGLYKHLIRECLELGLSVTTFDLPGHGLSSGDRASIDSFQSYQVVLDAIIKDQNIQHGSRWSIIGQSTGGAVILDYLSRNQFTHEDCPFSNVILLAPLVRPTGWFTGRIMLRLVRPFKDSIARGFAQSSHDKAFLRFIRHEDPLQHDRLEVSWVSAMDEWIGDVESRASSDLLVHVIQGTDDNTVDWQHNLPQIKKLFKTVSINTIKDARHHLVAESLEFRSQVFSFVRRILGASD